MDKTPPEDTDAIKEHPDIRINTNLYFIFGISLMAVMGVSSIAPAFPIIMDEFALSEWEVGLLISFFTFPGIVFSPVAGIVESNNNASGLERRGEHNHRHICAANFGSHMCNIDIRGVSGSHPIVISYHQCISDRISTL